MTYLEYLELWDNLRTELGNTNDSLRRAQIQRQIDHLQYLIQRDGFENEDDYSTDYDFDYA